MNSLIAKHNIDRLVIHFIYIMGKIEVMSVSIDRVNAQETGVHGDGHNHVQPSECVACATVDFLKIVFADKTNFCIAPDDIRLGWISVNLNEIKFEDRYLIALSTDIQSEPVRSVFLKSDEKLMLN